MFFIAIPIMLLVSFLWALHSLKKELEREKKHHGETATFATKEMIPNTEEFL